MKVAVVGATGAVGKQLLSILAERKFPVTELIAFASPRSKGLSVRYADKEVPCRILEKGCFDGVDIAFFDASDAISKEWVPQAAASGAWVVDNSAAFRLDDDVLLLVPEVNGELLEKRLRDKKPSQLSARERILTGPNCSTAQMVVALKPLRDCWGLKRVMVSTYQSTSGAGAAAMQELTTQTRDLLDGKTVQPKAFPHQIAFNCIPHIGGFKGDGFTSEEQKMMAESRKLLGLPDLRIVATAVRVPTTSVHGESIMVELERPLGSVEEAQSALRAQPGVVLQDEPGKNVYPMGAPGTPRDGVAVEGASGRDAVYVGRVRRDPSVDQGLCLWVVSDNLRKGAALNAVQIGEMLVKTLR